MSINAILVLVLSAPLVAQSPAGFTGRWIGDDTRMGAGGDAVDSPSDAHGQPRPRAQRELTIDDRVDVVDLQRPDAARVSLPLSGVAITSRDASGVVTSARTMCEGAALVIRRAHRVRLPDGTQALVTIEEPHELLADGTLRIDSTSTSGTMVTTSRAIYRRTQ